MSGTPMWMRRWVLGSMDGFVLVATATILAADPAVVTAQERPIVLGQTEGFARGELTVFDYTENFICTNNLLNLEENLATAMPEGCALGQAPNDINNPRFDLEVARVLPLWVIVPFFEIVGIDDAACDGSTFCPEALDPTPDVFVQCPEKSVPEGGTVSFPLTFDIGTFGHCIFHHGKLAPTPDVAAVLASFLGGMASDFREIPLVNHSHVVDATPGGGSVPWRVIAFLVLASGQNRWPGPNGDCPADLTGATCFSSFDQVLSGIAAGEIAGPVPTTEVLFFGVHGLKP